MTLNHLVGTTALIGSILLGAASSAIAQGNEAGHEVHHDQAGSTAVPASDAAPMTTEKAPAVPATNPAGTVSPEMMRMATGLDATSMADALRHCATMQMAMAQAVEAGGTSQPIAAPSTSGEPAWVEAYQAANRRMHSGMDIEFSDDADVDFARGMIAHHAGAIDMARVVLEFGDDPELKQLAEDVIEAQEGEVQFLQTWLGERQP